MVKYLNNMVYALRTWSESGLVVVAAVTTAPDAPAAPAPTPTVDVQLLGILSARQESKLDGRFLCTKSTGRLYSSQMEICK